MTDKRGNLSGFDVDIAKTLAERLEARGRWVSLDGRINEPDAAELVGGALSRV